MNFESITRCRVCLSSKITQILDLGSQPPANSLRHPTEPEPSVVPLRLLFCEDCGLVQLGETVEPVELFENYVWVTATSETARQYSEIFAERALQRSEKPRPRVLEIASNDGTFLERFQERGCNVLGIDPARNIGAIATEKGIRNIEAFFGQAVGEEVLSAEGPFDIVVARNVIPHVKNIHSVILGIRQVLGAKSLGVIEVHDSRLIQDEIQYDYVYHEHLFYFSLKSVTSLLALHDLFVFDVERSPISGGSWVVYFSRERREASKVLDHARLAEERDSVNSLEKWQHFSEKTSEHRQDLKALTAQASEKMLAYGASARSSTLLNYCGIGFEEVYAVIDRNPLKQGLLTPGSRIPVVGFDESRQRLADESRILLLAWNFREEIIDDVRRAGFKGSFIVPLPFQPSVV